MLEAKKCDTCNCQMNVLAMERLAYVLLLKEAKWKYFQKI